METRLQLIEENFESQQSGKSDLLIHIGKENISYAIVDQGREQLKALIEYKASLSDLNDIVQSDRYLNYFYRKIKIATDTFKFTFIPRDLYDASELQHYSRFIQPVSQAEVLVNDIRSFRIKNVMALGTGIQQTTSAAFRQPALYSQANPFLEGSSKISSRSALNHLSINIQPERLEIAVIKNAALLFYNLFESNTPDDLNYFILLVIKQFELDADNTTVTLAGNVVQADACYERLTKYFTSIQPADPRSYIQCSERFDDIDIHRYFSLLSLNLCE